MAVTDCPALTVRHHDKGYPFGERVPSKIAMKRTVHSDLVGIVPDAAPPAIISATYDTWVNSYGAVAAVLPDGRKLGVKPDEFEVVEWFTPSKAGASHV